MIEINIPYEGFRMYNTNGFRLAFSIAKIEEAKPKISEFLKCPEAHPRIFKSVSYIPEVFEDYKTSVRFPILNADVLSRCRFLRVAL